jgi:hypothetical protein
MILDIGCNRDGSVVAIIYYESGHASEPALSMAISKCRSVAMRNKILVARL